LAYLEGGELRGEEIRVRLEGDGWSGTLPAFYQLMGRMERSGLVAGRYVGAASPGRSGRERRYALGGEGEKALWKARSFYGRLLGRPGSGGGGAR
jgi:DNA-binding PadR family transcriptional regulator